MRKDDNIAPQMIQCAGLSLYQQSNNTLCTDYTFDTHHLDYDDHHYFEYNFNLADKLCIDNDDVNQHCCNLDRKADCMVGPVLVIYQLTWRSQKFPPFFQLAHF